MGSKEAHFDSIRDDLEEKQQRLDAEIQAYTNRRKLYENKEDDLEREYDIKKAELESSIQKRREELDLEFANFNKAKENFDTELKVFPILLYIVSERPKKTVQFTCSSFPAGT